MAEAPLTSADNDSRPYRPCVGLMLLNRDGRVFVGNRIDTPGNHWQMPQGGIDEGEQPREAAIRELREEIGTDRATILAESSDWYSYDLPPALSRKVWKGRYRGQTQKWFALRFDGVDADIDLETHHPEFSTWQWADVGSLIDLIVPFKRDIYRQVVSEFRYLADPVTLAKF